MMNKLTLREITLKKNCKNNNNNNISKYCISTRHSLINQPKTALKFYLKYYLETIVRPLRPILHIETRYNKLPMLPKFISTFPGLVQCFDYLCSQCYDYFYYYY